ncbi:fructose-bisphosphatase class II [Pseudonocardia alni]|nr:fructose-bisphosphatase class II [Pseudonocardia alni]
MDPPPDEVLMLELVRATESGAVVAGRCSGHHGAAGTRGDDRDPDRDRAVAAMRARLADVGLPTAVALGRDGPSGRAPACTAAFGLTRGTPSAGGGAPAAFAAAVVARSGAVRVPPPGEHGLVLAVGAGVHGAEVGHPVPDILRAVAAARGVRVTDLVVACADTAGRGPADAVRAEGARAVVPAGGVLEGAITAACPTRPVDLMLGHGPAAEAVLAAAAVRCLGGSVQFRTGAGGLRRAEDLVGSGGVVFCATAVGDGTLLRGVRVRAGRVITRSLTLASAPRSARLVETEHGLRPAPGTAGTSARAADGVRPRPVRGGGLR